MDRCPPGCEEHGRGRRVLIVGDATTKDDLWEHRVPVELSMLHEGKYVPIGEIRGHFEGLEKQAPSGPRGGNASGDALAGGDQAPEMQIDGTLKWDGDDGFGKLQKMFLTSKKEIPPLPPAPHAPVPRTQQARPHVMGIREAVRLEKRRVRDERRLRDAFATFTRRPDVVEYALYAAPERRAEP